MSGPTIAFRRGVVALALCAGAHVPSAWACGYEEQLGGAISAAHPGSIDVAIAIHDAFAAKRLKALPPVPSEAGLARSGALVRQAHQGLRLQTGASAPAIALLLVESRQWNRYTSAVADGIELHVEEPQPSDVVLVTGEVVLRALVDGRLNWREAKQRGLVVMIGEPLAMAEVDATFARRFDARAPTVLSLR